MAQGDPTTSGYAAGTPDTYLAAREAGRNGPDAQPARIQEVTHGLVGPISGSKAVVAAGTRVALAAVATKARVVIVQYAKGSGVLVVGGATVVAAGATRAGFALYQVGDWHQLEVNDLSEVYIDSTIAGDAVSFNYWTL